MQLFGNNNGEAEGSHWGDDRGFLANDLSLKAVVALTHFVHQESPLGVP